MSTDNKSGNKKISYALTFILIALAIATSSVVTYLIFHKENTSIEAQQLAINKNTADCTPNVVGLKGYKLVKPLLYTEKECESESLSSLKGDIANFIDQQKQAGNISGSSVYLRMLSTDEWTSVNANESYYPGSLIKLPMLIAFLRMEEAKPGFLNQKVTYNPNSTVLKQTFESKTIEAGHTYTLRELLEYMITYSDNNATQLLNSYMNIDAINNVFRDIGLTPPPASMEYFNYKISSKEFSKFMIGIYNSTYLSNPASEYAAELLTKSDFKEGLLKQLPPNVKIAHKFGEAGHGAELQLHESAIVFINDKPYIITVMTKGSDVKKLAEVLSQISKIVYDRFNVPAV